MVQSNLAYEFVDDIPWDENPAFAFSDDAEEYLRAFREVVDVIPVGGGKISFSNEVWDFNPYFDGINDDSLKVQFIGLPQPLADYCKFFVLYSIMGKKKISTANVRLSSFRSVYGKIVSTTSHDSIRLITTEDIINEVNQRNISAGGQHDIYESVYQVYAFLKGNYKLDLPVDLEKLKNAGINAKVAAKKDESKLPNIPEEYFLAIISTAVRVMRDVTQSYNYRAFACMLVMLSQLGLRLGDLLALRTDQLHRKKLAKSGIEAYYIHYKSRKPSKPHDKMLEFDIFSTPLCTEAFNTLKELRNFCPLSAGNDYLFVLEKHINSKDELPIPNHRFNLHYKKFLYTFLPELCTHQWDGIPWSQLHLGKDKYVRLAVPDTRQYRVHICTALYEKGIPLAYIQKYMGHLSEYMLGYYVRPKDTFQENVKYTEEIVKEIAGDGLTPLGGSFGEDIKANIQKFIEENNFNVQTDIESIVKAMGDKVIVRGKTGGVCIKTSLMACPKDARTNEMFCAYNLCPNLFTFFYMADVTYMDFKVLQDTYEAMRSTGKTKAAQKELNKLKELCRRRLLPELKELRKELEKQGKDTICIKYPTLSEIVANQDEIEKEVSEWMNKS